MVLDLEITTREYLYRLDEARNLYFQKGNKEIKIKFPIYSGFSPDDLTKEKNIGLSMTRLRSGYYNKEYVKSVSGLIPNITEKKIQNYQKNLF